VASQIEFVKLVTDDSDAIDGLLMQ